MASRVAYLAESLGTVEGAWALGMPELLRATGGNAGNLAFWHAARLLFDAEDVTLISRDTSTSAERAVAKCATSTPQPKKCTLL